MACGPAEKSDTDRANSDKDSDKSDTVSENSHKDSENSQNGSGKDSGSARELTGNQDYREWCVHKDKEPAQTNKRQFVPICYKLQGCKTAQKSPAAPAPAEARVPQYEIPVPRTQSPSRVRVVCECVCKYFLLLDYPCAYHRTAPPRA